MAARFVVRVELRNLPPNESEKYYANLDRRMAVLGLTTRIPAAGGATYQLPRAEYWIEGEHTRDSILAKVFPEASAVNGDCGVLVSEITSASWRGLIKL